MKIAVLLSTYNGQRFLQEQIESVLAQDITAHAELTLFVRDDGSRDATCAILEKYSKEKKIQYYAEENIGVARSFWNLINKAPESDYYAFCDQDDVWFPGKLSQAVKKLELQKKKNEPLLYCGSFTATDADLHPLQPVAKKTSVRTDFSYALLYSIAPGCTFVFNHAARKVLLLYDMEKETPFIHDWMAHKIIAMSGTMVFDETPSLYYRQHGKNAIGVQRGIPAFINRCRRVFNGKSVCVRSSCAQSLLNVYADDLTPEKAATLDVIANYKTDREKRKILLQNKSFKTESLQDILFYTLVLMKKI